MASLTVGAILKASVDYKTKQLKLWERIINVLLSICVGWISWRFLRAVNLEKYIGVVVPLCTLLGETFTLWIITKATDFFNSMYEKYIPKKK